MYIYTITFINDVFLAFEELADVSQNKIATGPAILQRHPSDHHESEGCLLHPWSRCECSSFKPVRGWEKVTLTKSSLFLDGTWTFRCFMMWHPLKQTWVKPWWPSTAHQTEWTIFQERGWRFVFWMLRFNRTTKMNIYHLSNLKGSEWSWWSLFQSGFMDGLWNGKPITWTWVPMRLVSQRRCWCLWITWQEHWVQGFRYA